MHVEEKDTAETKVMHTPSPWRHTGTGIEAKVFDGSWKWITPVVHGGNPTQATANRALIASAPDLLKAAKAVVNSAIDPTDGKPFTALRAAIALAEGRS